ncbi:MAG: M81 family metallopeptidase [Alphaproteobacteria bacterium]|nr:M81 family metallopeptidase [Alphaproteobacteria bacterium]
MARIVIGGFQHETNTFAPTKADYRAFERGGGFPPLTSGDSLFSAMEGVNIAIAGFIEKARADGHALLPTTWCAAPPSAHVTEETYERIAGAIVEQLKAHLPVDAVYLCLHGAMVTEHFDDGEGELLRRVRDVVGPEIPIVGSLDLHTNGTRLMFDSADALVAFRTYPHVDMAVTGGRAYALMKRLLTGERFAKAFRQLPFLIPLSWQTTFMEPGRTLYERVGALEGGDVLSVSFNAGFPAADIADCGPTVLAYGTESEAVERAADAMVDAIAQAEHDFAGVLHEADDAVAEAIVLSQGADKPVVIADTQDNPGAGGDSNTTGMLRALVAADAQNAALGLLFDPAAAEAAHEAGVGAEITLALGGQSKVPGDAPFEATFTVESLPEGKFTCTGPFYSGARMDLSPMATLRIGGVRVVVGSKKVQMADRMIFRHAGVVPEDAAILVVKSSAHFRADFEPYAHAVLVAESPGPMIADPGKLPWKNLRSGMRVSGGDPLG